MGYMYSDVMIGEEKSTLDSSSIWKVHKINPRKLAEPLVMCLRILKTIEKFLAHVSILVCIRSGRRTNLLSEPSLRRKIQ